MLYNADIFKKFYVCGNEPETKNATGNRTAETENMPKQDGRKQKCLLKTGCRETGKS